MSNTLYVWMQRALLVSAVVAQSGCTSQAAPAVTGPVSSFANGGRPAVRAPADTAPGGSGALPSAMPAAGSSASLDAGADDAGPVDGPAPSAAGSSASAAAGGGAGAAGDPSQAGRGGAASAGRGGAGGHGGGTADAGAPSMCEDVPCLTVWDCWGGWFGGDESCGFTSCDFFVCR